MKKTIFPFLAVLAGLALSSCNSNLEPPQFKKFGDFKVKQLGLQQADIGFSVTYYNPNKFGVAVKEAAVDVYVDSIYMGRFVQPDQVSVDRMADFTIPLQGSIPLSKALQLNVRDMLNKDVLVKAAGSVKVGKAGIFVSRDINYQGKHKVDIKL